MHSSLVHKIGVACASIMIVAASAVTAAAAATPLAVFTVRERTGADWPRTLVTYELRAEGAGPKDEGTTASPTAAPVSAISPSPVQLSGPAVPDELRLIDAAKGTETPFQLSRVTTSADGRLLSAQISFFASLPAMGSYRYELHAGHPAASEDAAGILVAVGDDWLELDNGIVAVRFPTVGEYAFTEPRAWESVPGPIAGLRLSNGAWIGATRFAGQAASRVQGFEVTLNEKGPLFTEVTVRYTLDNGGVYRLNAQVRADDAAVRIDEVSDLQTTGEAWAVQLVMALDGGEAGAQWQPDTAYWFSVEGRLRGKYPAFELAMEQLGFDGKPFQGRNFGAGPIEFPDAEEEPMRVFDLSFWYLFHRSAHYLALADSRALPMREVSPSGGIGSDVEAAGDDVVDDFVRDVVGGDQARAIPFAAIVPLNAGAWRGASAHINGHVNAHAGGGLTLHWPLGVDGYPRTLLHTGEYDPDLPPSSMRRRWALVGGPIQYYEQLQHLRGYEGAISLNRYKDWDLSWAEDVRDAPDAVIWRGHRPGGGFGGAWLSGYHQATGVGRFRNRFRETPPGSGQHAALRLEAAARANSLSEPDFNPRGSMVHLGTPNMPVNRFMALPFVASLIPDHPRTEEWMRVTAEYVRYKLAANTAPGGAWSESISYFYAAAPMLIYGAMLAEEFGILDDATRELAALPAAFTVNLLTPEDPRFGCRRVPGFGHEGHGLFGSPGPVKAGSHLLGAAGLLHRHDRDRAAAMAWAWDRINRPGDGYVFDCGFDGELKERYGALAAQATPEAIRAALSSVWMPGFGAVLRAHADTPGETYLALRQGYMISHSDANQGDFILYAKGAPLTTMSLHGYPIDQHPDTYGRMYNEFGWHSHPRFGSQDRAGYGGSALSQVHAYGFGESVDYIRSVREAGPQHWTRQILFIKGRRPEDPSYFVFRDSAHSPQGDTTVLEPKWWYQRTLGEAEQVRAHSQGFDYTSRFGPRMLTRFLQPATVVVESRQVQSPRILTRISTAGEPETPLTINAVGPIAAGEDIVAAIVPLGADEPAPKDMTSLADGAVRIVTDAAVNYLFVHRHSISYSEDDITFSGRAGAVRVFPDEVHLIIAEGPGTVGYRGVTLTSDEPATRILPLTEVQGQHHSVRVPPKKHDIVFALDPAAGPIEEVEAGVRRQNLANRFAIEFDSDQPLTFSQDNLTFNGRHGGIVVDKESGAVTFTLLDAERASYGDEQIFSLDGQCGPCEVRFGPHEVSGRTAGPGRFLYIRTSAEWRHKVVLEIDGMMLAPGTAGATLIVPVMPDARRFTLRDLPQPPVFRAWQLWEDVEAWPSTAADVRPPRD